VVDHVLAGETVTGFLAYPYSYLVRALAGGVYDAIDAGGTRVYGGPDDAGGVDGADADAVIIAALAAGANVTLDEGTFPCGETRIQVLSSKSLKGAGKEITKLTFTGGGGVDLGVNSGAMVQTQYAQFEGVTLTGDGSEGSIGLRRTNNLYGTIRNVEIDGFKQGFVEESWYTGINIANIGYDILIRNCKYGVTWNRRDPQGGFPVGNNLNLYYWLGCYGTTGEIVADSIAYRVLDADAVVVTGGWTEKYDTGIKCTAGNANKFKEIWMEACNTYVQYDAGVIGCETDAMLYWSDPEVVLVDNGTGCRAKFTKTIQTEYNGIAQTWDTPLIWKLGTAVNKHPSATELGIGHDNSDNMIFNHPTGKSFIFRENAGGVAFFWDGWIWVDTAGKGLKLKSPNATVYNITMNDSGQLCVNGVPV